jgi:hypothetical protein
LRGARIMRSAAKPAKKKPYQSPKLLIYGKLTDMTLTRGRKGAPDGGHGNTARSGR